MPKTRTLKRTRSISVSSESSKKRRETSSEVHIVKLKPSNNDVGSVLAFGSGEVGQLGLGEDIIEKLRPALVPGHEDIIDIAAGGMHNICLKKDGSVLSWGCNDEGALGRQGAESLPDAVKLPAPAIMISAGDSHSCALLEDGRVLAWGSFRDASGSMGLVSTNIEKAPIQLLSEQFVVQIASGADHLVMLTDKGDLYTIGCGQQGQLGRLSSRETVRERRQGIKSSLEVKPVSVKASKKTIFDKIWATTYGTFATEKSTGDMYVFGLNNYHQIGLKKEEPYYRPTRSDIFKTDNWKKISGGLHHTLALSSNGKVFALGRKEYGRLGLGENCEDATELVPVPKLEDKKCVDISCGSSMSFAVTDSGELYSWGMGTGGALGTGEEEDVYEPVLVKGKQLTERTVLRVASGGQHTIALACPAKNNNTNNGEKMETD